MASKNANFEVQVCRDGRWSAESYLEDEAGAIASAKRYLNDKKIEGVKVLRNWVRPDGRVIENEIFCETRTVKDDGPIRIVQIDGPAPKCEVPDDYMAQESRGIMNRVLRPYLDKVVVTPTELLHNYKELKRIQDKDTLIPSAVDRIAFLQTRDGEQDAKVRRDDIFKNIDSVSARARKADGLSLPKLKDRFKDMYDQVADMAGADDADYMAMVVLSRDLVNVRNWLGKLDRLCRLASEEGDSHALTLLDGVIADVLGSNVVQEILGWQPSLAAAIISMLDLAEGRLVAEKSEAGESTEMLNQLFREGKLPASRACLIDRALRQLRSPNPLYRSEGSKEREAFDSVMARLLTPTGLLFGAESAESLTVRYTRMVVEGGAAGRRAAMFGVFHAMPDRAFGVMYLCDLARSDMAKDHVADIAELFGRVLETRNLRELCDRALPPKDRMLRATNAHRAAMASPLPVEFRRKVGEHIDGILEHYLIEEQIVEKLDHADSSLRDRAVRLVNFCAAGVLPEGRAMTRARQRILLLLRQANFDARFVDGISDPGKAQKALRDFHQLLVRAGFGS